MLVKKLMKNFLWLYFDKKMTFLGRMGSSERVGNE